MQSFHEQIEQKYGLQYSPVFMGNTRTLVDAQRAVAVENGFDYVFSVIVPIHNMEAYLRECIESVVNQSIGFGDTQLILVDDGSADNSAEICLEYAELYPNNVLFLRQKNAGCSAARNNGLDFARGLWVNFLDADDMWSVDAFEVALRFLDAHWELHMVSMRHILFGAANGRHALDYKYERDRVVDIMHDADMICLAFSNVFIRHELIRDLKFDEDLDFAEDYRLMGPLMLREKRYGVCREGAYLYRKRFEGGSAIDTSTGKESYYEVVPYRCDLGLFEESYRIYGEVIPYAQWCVMYQLQFRLGINVAANLNDGAIKQYRSIITKLLSFIEDEVIVTQRHLSLEGKLYALSIKYGVSVSEMIDKSYMHGGELYWRHEGQGTRLFSPSILSRKLQVEMIDYHDGTVSLRGWCEFLFEDAHNHLCILFEANGQKLETNYVQDSEHFIPVAFQVGGLRRKGFEVSVPWNDGRRLAVSAKISFDGLEYDALLVLGGDVDRNRLNNRNICIEVENACSGGSSIIIQRECLSHKVYTMARQTKRLAMRVCRRS